MGTTPTNLTTTTKKGTFLATFTFKSIPCIPYLTVLILHPKIQKYIFIYLYILLNSVPSRTPEKMFFALTAVITQGF